MKMKMSWLLLDLEGNSEGLIVPAGRRRLQVAQQRSYPFNSHSPARAAAGASP
jgi:hypothetical protein